MEKPIIVFIDWIRHGFSCANAIKMEGHVGPKNIIKNVIKEGNLGDSRGKYAADSLLTDLGIKQAESVNKSYTDRIKEYDLILSSELSRAAETALVVGKNSKVKKIYMVPYISEERSPAALMLDKDNQARDPKVVKEELENRFPTTEGYPGIDISYIERFKGKYNPNTPTSPDFDSFYKRVLPLILSENLKENRNIYNIAIVSHNFFIKKIFKSRYGDYLKHPIDNLQINTEVIKIDGNRLTWELPKECATNETNYCRIPIHDQNKVIPKPNELKKNDVQRCITLSKEGKKVEQLFNLKGGYYYDKYMKYKLKYLQLKNQ